MNTTADAELDKLVHMANRIGQFFEAMPDGAEARAGVATHLQRYWPPSMRHALWMAAAEGRAPALMPLVQQALQQLPGPAARS